MIRVPDQNLRIEAGDILFIIGGSGTGKTALLNCFGLLPSYCPQEKNQLLFTDAHGNTFDAKVSGDPERTRRLRKSEIGHISSHSALIPFLTLRQNICMTRTDPAVLKTLTESLGWNSDDAWLDQHPPRHTPIDIQRKVLVARELFKRPRLLLADDPASGVCPDTQQRIWETLLQRDSPSGEKPAVIIALRCSSAHAPSEAVLEKAINERFRLRCMSGQVPDVPSETRFEYRMIGEDGHDIGMTAEECHGHLHPAVVGASQ